MIVHNQVNSTADLVAIQLREVEALRHDALSRKSSITMDQDRNDFLTIDGVLEDALTCTGLAQDDRVDRLEMARIGGKIDLDLLTLLVAAGCLVTQVVLHVSAGIAKVRSVFVAEFVEDDGEGLLEEICQDIQSAAMSHSQDDLLHTGPGGAEEDLGEGHHHRFTTLERETLAADIGSVDEVLETLRFVQCAKNPVMGGLCVTLPDPGLDTLADPVTDAWILNVHVLDTQGVAVNGAQLRNDVAKLHWRPISEGTGTDRYLKISFRESELL